MIQSKSYLLSLCHLRMQWEGSPLKAKRRCFRMKPTLLTPRSWTSQLPELREVNSCCLSHQSLAFCYGSSSRLTQGVYYEHHCVDYVSLSLDTPLFLSPESVHSYPQQWSRQWARCYRYICYWVVYKAVGGKLKEQFQHYMVNPMVGKSPQEKQPPQIRGGRGCQVSAIHNVSDGPRRKKQNQSTGGRKMCDDSVQRSEGWKMWAPLRCPLTIDLDLLWKQSLPGQSHILPNLQLHPNLYF